MNPIWIVLLDLLLVYFVFGHSLVRRFYSRNARTRAELRDLERHYAHMLLKDRDVLPQECIASLTAATAELRGARREGDVKEAAACLERYHTSRVVTLPRRSQPWLRDNLEVLIVALGLAFGVRALFLQPFKIPTGSMQPTLFGIHFLPSQEPVNANPIRRFFGYLNYTKRYVDISVKSEGYLDLASVRSRSSIPFFPRSLVDVGDATYTLPGARDDVLKYLMQLHGRGTFLRKGDVLARGALQLGDHLFVDRTDLAFSEPKRGDVMVFVTDGITQENGAPLGGRFYIKRLVGMPGDTLRIRDGRLYVKESGATDFRLVDAEDDPGFPRIYSMKGGYHGYTNHSRAARLTDGDDTFAIPRGRYFMLGDNSAFSLDGRFWGTVPRANLVGRALWVWWPFARRCGLVDRLDPLDFETSSRMRDPDLPPLLE